MVGYSSVMEGLPPMGAAGALEYLLAGGETHHTQPLAALPTLQVGWQGQVSGLFS